MEESPKETEKIHYVIDGVRYSMEQNIFKRDRAVEMLKQYFPDVVVIPLSELDNPR